MNKTKAHQGYDNIIKGLTIAAIAMMLYGCAKSNRPTVSSTGAGDGMAIFNQNCARCHGEDGNKIPPWKGKVNNMSHAKAVDTIVKGFGRMPPFGTSLTSQQIDQVATYVQDLAVK